MIFTKAETLSSLRMAARGVLWGTGDAVGKEVEETYLAGSVRGVELLVVAEGFEGDNWLHFVRLAFPHTSFRGIASVSYHPFLILIWHNRVTKVLRLRNFAINTAEVSARYLLCKRAYRALIRPEVAQITRTSVDLFWVIVPWI